MRPCIQCLFFVFLLLFVPIFAKPWGKDADLATTAFMQKNKKVTYSPASQAMLSIIYFHQNFISPTDGPRSHFNPTSSHYMYQAILKYGFIKGYILGSDRLLRENNEDWIYPKRMMGGNRWVKWDPVP